MFTVWHGLFSLVLIFPGLRIEAPPPSTVQGQCVYILFKAEHQKIHFPLLCTKPSKDKHTFFFFQRLIVPEPICQPAVPSMYYQFGRFIGQACQISRMERADLSAKHANYTRLLGRFIDQVCQNSQMERADVSANRNQRANTFKNIISVGHH